MNSTRFRRSVRSGSQRRLATRTVPYGETDLRRRWERNRLWSTACSVVARRSCGAFPIRHYLAGGRGPRVPLVQLATPHFILYLSLQRVGRVVLKRAAKSRVRWRDAPAELPSLPFQRTKGPCEGSPRQRLGLLPNTNPSPEVGGQTLHFSSSFVFYRLLFKPKGKSIDV